MFFFVSSFRDTWEDSAIWNVGLRTLPIRKVFQLNLSLMQLKIFNPLLDWKKRVRSLKQYLHLPSGLVFKKWFAGNLDKETLEVMNKPRCGVPDRIRPSSSRTRPKRFALEGMDMQYCLGSYYRFLLYFKLILSREPLA
jgi:hypothetical protein